MTIPDVPTHRVTHPVPDAPNFQLTLYDDGPTVDTSAQEKALAQLARGKVPKPRKPAQPVGLSLGGGDFAVQQQREYEKVMGRTWDEIDPEPSASKFGGPTPPRYPSQPPRTYSPAQRRRQKAEYETAMNDYLAAYEQYRAVWDVWKETDAHARLSAARNYWATRRAQFDWTGRGRNSKSLAELVGLTIDGEPA